MFFFLVVLKGKKQKPRRTHPHWKLHSCIVARAHGGGDVTSTKTQVSRAKWRPGHQDQIATAQVPLMGEKDFAMMVHDVTEPAVAHFALYGGDDKKNGFCWLDTPLNFLESGGGPPRPSAPPPGAASSSVSVFASFCLLPSSYFVPFRPTHLASTFA